MIATAASVLLSPVEFPGSITRAKPTSGTAPATTRSATGAALLSAQNESSIRRKGIPSGAGGPSTKRKEQPTCVTVHIAIMIAMIGRSFMAGTADDILAVHGLETIRRKPRRRRSVVVALCSLADAPPNGLPISGEGRPGWSIVALPGPRGGHRSSYEPRGPGSAKIGRELTAFVRFTGGFDNGTAPSSFDGLRGGDDSTSQDDFCGDAERVC